jgi:hypothetical protein
MIIRREDLIIYESLTQGFCLFARGRYKHIVKLRNFFYKVDDGHKDKSNSDVIYCQLPNYLLLNNDQAVKPSQLSIVFRLDYIF